MWSTQEQRTLESTLPVSSYIRPSTLPARTPNVSSTSTIQLASPWVLFFSKFSDDGWVAIIVRGFFTPLPVHFWLIGTFFVVRSPPWNAGSFPSVRRACWSGKWATTTTTAFWWILKSASRSHGISAPWTKYVKEHPPPKHFQVTVLIRDWCYSCRWCSSAIMA